MQEIKIALKNAGKIDPYSIEDYKNAGGFKAVETALEKEPTTIIEEIHQSKLRGRGGAGFPAGMKSRFTDEAICHYCGPKYIVCNADEGEPGTFKDRAIMEQDPHLVIEGMIISAIAIGAEKGYIYIRGEYIDSIKKIRHAIKNCYETNLLGNNILGSEFSFELEIRLGAGSYLCGEELTLLESLEGKRGYPRIKPPFPAEKGLFGCPTLINNVETFAHIPFIINEGKENYLQYGTENSPGTKIFTISGDVEKPGYYETEMGVTLRQLIDEFSGGMKDNKKFKAAIFGGAAGTFVNESIMDTPIGFDTLKEKGAVLGSGAVMVMGEDRSLYDMLLSVLEFFEHESCGKCTPCRVGSTQLVLMLKGMQDKSQSERTKILHKMKSEAEYMQQNSLCPLGASHILPVGSILQYFEDKL
ncbi:MAG: NADH-quinone oxidoreductase subunit NuoF [Bacteroidales bacterium]